MKAFFKVVPDTNVLLASETHPGSTSPNTEFVERWKREEFIVLYSDDTLLEYIHIMRRQGIAETRIKQLIQAILTLGSVRKMVKPLTLSVMINT